MTAPAFARTAREPTAAELKWALAAVDQGVVLAGPDGTPFFRSDRVDQLTGRTHVGALIDDAIGRLLRRAVLGERCSEPLELHGPPRRSIAVSARPIEDGGAVVGALAVVEDCTEKRRLAAVRRDFVANISHELKTPVGALALLAETLAGERDASTFARLAARMEAEAQRVARIIDDLLDLSRIESEEPLGVEPVDVVYLVMEAVERVRAAAEHRHIAVVVGSVPDDRLIVGDRRQLVSALYNLLENAVKYSDDGRDVTLRGHATEGYVEIEVGDRGIGIASYELDRIFERFYRVDRARGRDTGGTGLGLAIVRHVVQNHGGEVSVRSTEGVGSTFTLRLPAQVAVRAGERDGGHDPA